MFAKTDFRSHFTLEKCEAKRKFLYSFQAISNKQHNCCNSNNNNCIKICDSQIAQAVQEKEKEGLEKEDEESYNKFRQLLSYDDVSWRSNFLNKNLTFISRFSGSKLSSVQSIHSQRIPHNAAHKTLLGVDILVDEWNCEKKIIAQFSTFFYLFVDFFIFFFNRSTYGRTYLDCFCSSHFPLMISPSLRFTHILLIRW